MASNVAGWFEAAPADQHLILDALRKTIVASGSRIVEDIKWSRPCYSNERGRFFYLFSTKSYATLGFQKEAGLNDPARLLEGEAKDMRHIKVRTLAQARDSNVLSLIKQAAGPSRSSQEVATQRTGFPSPPHPCGIPG
jgi:hypothetical protein